MDVELNIYGEGNLQGEKAALNTEGRRGGEESGQVSPECVFFNSKCLR
jgi:hypothetical protein